MNSKFIAYPLHSLHPIPSDARDTFIEWEGRLVSFQIPVSLVGAEQCNLTMPADSFISTQDTHGEKIHCAIAPCNEAEICVLSEFSSTKDAEKRTAEFESMYAGVIAGLKKKAGMFGVSRIVFHVDAPNTHAPLPVLNKEQVDVFIFCTPSEIYGEREVLEEIFELPITRTSFGLPVLFGPCPLRGGVVVQDKKALSQYIGNTLYILFDPETLEERGGVYSNTCFEELILKTLEYRHRHIGRQSDENEHPALFLEITSENAAEEIARMEKTLRESRKARSQKILEIISRIESDLIKYRREFAELRAYEHTPVQFFSTIGSARPETLSSDLSQVVTNPLVQSVRLFSEKGIYLKTKALCIEHEGVRYAIGTFGILFRYDGLIDIWSGKSFHPKGVPHPHISLLNSCLGNAGDMIRLACSEFRYGDAIHYYLVWLEHGYTPENVIDHPVEEWPVYNEKEHTCE